MTLPLRESVVYALIQAKGPITRQGIQAALETPGAPPWGVKRISRALLALSKAGKIEHAASCPGAWVSRRDTSGVPTVPPRDTWDTLGEGGQPLSSSVSFVPNVKDAAAAAGLREELEGLAKGVPPRDRGGVPGRDTSDDSTRAALDLAAHLARLLENALMEKERLLAELEAARSAVYDEPATERHPPIAKPPRGLQGLVPTAEEREAYEERAQQLRDYGKPVQHAAIMLERVIQDCRSMPGVKEDLLKAAAARKQKVLDQLAFERKRQEGIEEAARQARAQAAAHVPWTIGRRA